MAYSTSNAPALISQRVGSKPGAIWVYKDGDPFDTVLAADYISNGDALGMQVGDQVVLIDDTNSVAVVAHVSAVTSGGAASLSVKKTQELTESGAVSPGAEIIELNHATVVVAATVADAAVYAGKLLVIKDTSASGTAAHTVTLTAGTFDGSNNVATLNAPGEQLVVLFDDTGNGVIIQNTGSVALS
jgi:hypothetical protein